MASRWPVLSLESAGVSLIDCVHKTPAALDGGYPYVAIPQLKGGHIDIPAARQISASDFAIWTKKVAPQAHDVVLSRRCNPGETAYVPPNVQFALGQNLVLLRADGEKIYPPFLRWLVRSPEWWNQIQKHLNVGAVFDSLRCADVPKFELPVPSISEQRAIASILSSLDDKIELNRKMSATLESMARALFRSWFVNFEPVRAKAEGCDSRLPTETAALFADSFKDSELGEIPTGWRIGRFDSILTRRTERREPSSETAMLPYVPIDCISSRSLLLQEIKPGAEARSSLTAFYKGDILFGAMRPYFHKVCIAPFNGTTRTTVFVLRPLRQGDLSFAAFLAHRDETIDYATAHSTGSTIPYAVWDGSLDGMPVIVPPVALRDYFNDVVSPMLDSIQGVHFENATLASLRDTLLPKLTSGELYVGEAERIVERSA